MAETKEELMEYVDRLEKEKEKIREGYTKQEAENLIKLIKQIKLIENSILIMIEPLKVDIKNILKTNTFQEIDGIPEVLGISIKINNWFSQNDIFLSQIISEVSSLVEHIIKLYELNNKLLDEREKITVEKEEEISETTKAKDILTKEEKDMLPEEVTEAEPEIEQTEEPPFEEEKEETEISEEELVEEIKELIGKANKHIENKEEEEAVSYYERIREAYRNLPKEIKAKVFKYCLDLKNKLIRAKEREERQMEKFNDVLEEAIPKSPKKKKKISEKSLKKATFITQSIS